jgi:nucleotide-binding universal stress UspA family protein
MYHRLLVPLDGSAPSERGLHEAIRLAADQKATLFLLHVLDDYPMLSEGTSARSYEATLNRMRRHGSELLAKANDAAAEAGIHAKTVLREVSPATVADAILDEAVKLGCDLIVMGTHGRRGVSRLTMGSEAELVVRMSPVPVLLVRKEAHVAEPAVA